MSYKNVVSVIIPTFNRLTMLREAVRSALAQTYDLIELIVVDDGSTDGTEEEFTSKTDLTYIRTSQNRGVSATRNLGMLRSRGEYLAFLDSDDLWEPEKIEAQVHFFGKNPELQIAQTEEIWYRRGQRVNPRKIHKKFGGEIFAHCLPRCVVSPSAVMLKRALLEKVGTFDESLPACEDYDLWLRVAAKVPIGLLPEPLTIKRGGHQDQLSNQHSLDHYRIQALCKILNQNDLDELKRMQALRALQEKCMVYGRGCMKRGRREEAKRIFGLPEKMHNSVGYNAKESVHYA